LKIRHGAIVNNIATNLYTKFDDDRLWNEKASVDRKSDQIKFIKSRRTRWSLG